MPQHGQKHPFNGGAVPITLSHELSGIVVEIGNAVDTAKIKMGQKVL